MVYFQLHSNYRCNVSCKDLHAFSKHFMQVKAVVKERSLTRGCEVEIYPRWVAKAFQDTTHTDLHLEAIYHSQSIYLQIFEGMWKLQNPEGTFMDMDQTSNPEA